MSLIVSKFGGSSVADAAQIRKVAAIIAADAERRIIVVSAPGKRSSSDEKITDTLIACHALAVEKKDFRARFSVIRERYNGLAAELGIGSDLIPVLDEVEESIASGASRDAVVSRGEYLGAHMIARFIGFDFLDAADIIRFSDETTIDTGVTDSRCRESIDPAGRYVIPGFYGAHGDGRIQLFTRGGSDISGALVARAAGAATYENWTDVSGLLSADPRIVQSPDPIREVSYHELRELAYLGANVFHDEAVAPVAEADIPINIRNTNEPDHPGTVILSRERLSERRPGERTGVAGKEGFSGILIQRSMINKIINLAGQIESVLLDEGVRMHHCAQGADSVLVIAATGALDAAGPRLEEKLAGRFKATAVRRTGPYALVGAAGEELAVNPRVLGNVMMELARRGLAVHFVCSGYSESSFLLAVDEEQYREAVQAVYAATDPGAMAG